MAGLGAALITFTPSTVIRSSDVNANLAALNGATDPSFTTVTVSGLATLGHISSDGGKITSDGAGNVTITGNLSVSGSVSGGSSGGSTYTGTVAFKPASGDAYTVYATDATLGAAAGYYSSGTAGTNQVGSYLYDSANAGFVYQGATKNGITFTGSISAAGASFSGTVTAADFNGALGGGITSYDSSQYGIVGVGPGNHPAGARRGILFQSWNGITTLNLFSIGDSSQGVSYIDDSGRFNGGVITGSIYPTSNQGTWLVPWNNSTNVQVGLMGQWAAGYTPTMCIGYIDGGGTAHTNIQTGPNGTTINGMGMGGDVLQSTSGIMGFKNSGGGKLAEMQSNGNFVIAGQTFYSATTYVGYSANGSFDAFDFAETYPLDTEYESGTVVCPGPHETFTRCTHDNCHAATVVSLVPAFCAGGGMFDAFSEDDESAPQIDGPHAPLALVGRVRIRTSDAIHAGDLVCSDGEGGVRRARPGEEAFTLGYALHATHNGQVGVYLRPMWCRVPQRLAA